MQINPDITEAHALRGWYDQEGSHIATQSLSAAGRVGGGGPAPFKLAAEANEVTTLDVEKGDYFMSKVTLMAIKRDNAIYKACSTDKCNKKVLDLGNGMYRCEKCQKEAPTFKYRLMLQCNFADFTDNFWATAFQESGEVILGSTGEKLGDMFDNRSEEFDGVIKEALFQQYIVKIRSRMENYNNETRKKFTVQELTKINHAEYAKQLLADIRENSS
jgi:replication factor A1